MLGKHLHGRGEDSVRLDFASRSKETPPRTWRRPQPACKASTQGRNTSTDVEKTRASIIAATEEKKHLHGRGEDLESAQDLTSFPETPPRTWRRPGLMPQKLVRSRNTSTDVEKTRDQRGICVIAQKHLHGRGEDSCPVSKLLPWPETPPRTWRRQINTIENLARGRNTSTDVEKTFRLRP